MKLVVKGVKVSLTPSLRDYVEKKLVFPVKRLLGGSLSESAILDVELIHGTTHHKKGNIWEAAANLRLPRARIYEKVKSSEAHAALDELEDILKREIKKYKERTRSRLLRGARQAKKDFHFSRSARLWRQGRIREEGT